MQYDHDELLNRSQEYIDLMKKNGLGYFRLKNDKFEIELGEKPLMPPAPPPAAMMPPAFAAPSAQSPAPPCKTPQSRQEGSFVRSPIVGTFYAAPSPEKPPFAPAGKQVHKGDILFIIESMKLMNEVTSELDGTVAEVLVNDGDTVEFDQPIMRII